MQMTTQPDHSARTGRPGHILPCGDRNGVSVKVAPGWQRELLDG